MNQHDVSRRGLLKTSGAAVGASMIASLAGCVGEVPRAGAGSGGSQSFSNWLCEPGTIVDTNHYSSIMMNMGNVRSNEDNVSEDLYENFEAFEDYLSFTGIDFDEMSTTLVYNSIYVVTGSYTTEDVIEELEDNDYDDETDHEGFTIYLSSDGSTAVGVSEQALVARIQGYDSDSVDAVETIIDTKIGEEDRYVAESEDFETLMRTLDPGAYLTGRTYEEQSNTDTAVGTFEHAVAGGRRWRINGETSNLKTAIVFEEADDIDLDDINDWIDDTGGSDQTFDDVDDTDVKKQGRTAVITGTVDTDDVAGYHLG
jgi:hypothetical protein